MTTDPAVTAAEQAVRTRVFASAAEAAVVAARSIIEAEVRERIAADLLRDCRAERHSLSGNRTCRYCERAARIARGRS